MMLDRTGVIETVGADLQATQASSAQHLLQEYYYHHDPTPVSEYTELNKLFLTGFPTLFPYRRGGPLDDRTRKLILAAWTKHLLQLHKGTFARHESFMFVAFNIIQRKQASKSVHLQMQVPCNLAETATSEHLKKVLSTTPTNAQYVDDPIVQKLMKCVKLAGYALSTQQQCVLQC